MRIVLFLIIQNICKIALRKISENNIKQLKNIILKKLFSVLKNKK